MHDRWFTIALMVAEFGQVWAEHVRRDVTPQLWRKSDGKRKHSGGVAVTSRRFQSLVP